MWKYQRLAGAFLPLCGLLLTGCSSYRVPRPVPLQPPVLGCDADPDVPVTEDPAAVADYIVRLWAAGQSCRDAVGDYQRWADHLKKP